MKTLEELLIENGKNINPSDPIYISDSKENSMLSGHYDEILGSDYFSSLLNRKAIKIDERYYVLS